jgi:hypothetical protein
MSNRARMAEDLTIQQLQQSIQDGVVPSYIGVPLLKSKVEDAKLLQAAKAAQSMGQQPSVAQQIMSQAQQVSQPTPQMAPQAGVEGLSTNLPASMAGGGIVAFAEGGMYDEEDSDEDRQDAARQAEMDEMMDEYAQSFQQGIGQLPAAQEYAPPSENKEDNADFIARIMHKESRGRRYGKDGQLLTSEKGAQGEMQVMPGTSRDPGFGVKPARDGSPDELARVGRDYANTLLARYGDPKLAAIAYNMGPGATDKWLAAGADVSKLPKETQGYVKGFSGKDGESTVKDKYKGLWPYNAQEAGKFSYTDAAEFDARKKDDESEVKPKGNSGIKYEPTSAIGNVTPTRYVPKDEPQSEYARQMSNVGGFFGDALSTLGKHIVSAPGYGFSGMMRSDAAAPGQDQKPVDFKQFDAATERYMNDRDQARLAAARQGELGMRDKVASAKAAESVAAAAPIEKAMSSDVGGKADPYAKFEELFAKREENLAKQREQDKYMAMLQAGLGMMGGTSQHALANIGAGASQGIQSLAQSNAARTAEENALLSGRLGLAKIGSNKEYQDAMMQYRKELSEKNDARARDLAGANLTEKTLARTDREEAKALQRLTDISKNAEMQAEKAIAANPAVNFAADREAKKQAMIADILRRNSAYAKTYQSVHGKDADPFEGLGQTGGGGTRIKFDAQGNMIQ